MQTKSQYDALPTGQAHLSEKSLFRDACYINGNWVYAQSGKAIPVTNPFDDSFLGFIPDLSQEETRDAIRHAKCAQKQWQAELPQTRADILIRWHDLMIEHKEDLAILMVLEQGKPIREARGEIDYAADFLKWYGEEAKRVNVESVSSHLPNRSMRLERAPIGVVGAVTPWNFPAAMITRKAGAALAAGCSMVVRPASETPYSALALAELGARAGLPAGVFNVVTGDHRDVVKELCDNKDIRALSFTGSTEVGRILLRQGAETIKKMSMELGGHAPFIVTRHADLNKAVQGAIGAKFATTGQDCLAANRIYVHDSLYNDFARKFTEATKKLITGNGLSEESDLGPLMHERALAKSVEHVEDAKAKGATILTGGKNHPASPLCYEPTVLKNVTSDMKIYREETFGPVAPLISFTDEDDVIALANDTEYGLVAYLYTEDLSEANQFSAALDYGMVAVNTPKITGSPIPFGGVKQSGLGREGSRHGLEEFTEIKYICIEN